MSEIYIAVGIYLCFLLTLVFVMWRVRRLEKENFQLKNMIASSATLVYELSKLSSIIQDGVLEQGKGIVMLSKHGKETRDDLVELKTNVDKFVAVMVQQINVLHGMKGQSKSTVFGPVKKNDKIKPN